MVLEATRPLRAAAAGGLAEPDSVQIHIGRRPGIVTSLQTCNQRNGPCRHHPSNTIPPTRLYPACFLVDAVGTRLCFLRPAIFSVLPKERQISRDIICLIEREREPYTLPSGFVSSIE